MADMRLPADAIEELTCPKCGCLTGRYAAVENLDAVEYRLVVECQRTEEENDRPRRACWKRWSFIRQEAEGASDEDKDE